MYSRGITTRVIACHLKDIYGTDVSPELISRATDSVKDLLDEWRNRPLEPFYPLLFLNALLIPVKDDSKIQKKAFPLALAIRMDG
jgi:putative transposase